MSFYSFQLCISSGYGENRLLVFTTEIGMMAQWNTQLIGGPATELTHPKPGVTAMVDYMKESVLYIRCQQQKLKFSLMYVCVKLTNFIKLFNEFSQNSSIYHNDSFISIIIRLSSVLKRSRFAKHWEPLVILWIRWSYGQVTKSPWVWKVILGKYFLLPVMSPLDLKIWR